MFILLFGLFRSTCEHEVKLHTKYFAIQRIKIVDFFIESLCFNATFSNISAISWRPVLVVEEAGVPGENH